MGTFCYKHPETNEIIERVFPCEEKPEAIVVNGVMHERCFPAEVAGQGGIQASTWPMTSNALAIHPTQRREYSDFANKHGVPTEFDKKGRPVFRTRQHRKRYAELVGATDFDGGYSDPHCD